MMRSEFEFWKDYRNGKINRELTSDEEKEIRASDFAMHLLIPTDALLKEVGGFDNLVKIAYLVNDNSMKNKKTEKTGKKMLKKIIKQFI